MVNALRNGESLSEFIWSEGVLVHAYMGMWSMEARLKKEDVGLKDVNPELFKLGHKRLFPKSERNKFANIRTKVAQLLDANGVKFYPFLHGAYFVRYTVLNKVLTKLDGYQKEYLLLAENFVNHYDRLRTSWWEEHPNHQAMLEGYYPNPEKIRPKFKFGFYVSKLKEVMDEGDYLVGRTITEDDYAGWLEDTINDLRGDVTFKVQAIQKTIEEGNIDNRIKTRINKIKDQLIALDMTKDEVLAETLDALLKNPTVANAKAVVVKAKPLKTRQVRKLFLD